MVELDVETLLSLGIILLTTVIILHKLFAGFFSRSRGDTTYAPTPKSRSNSAADRLPMSIFYGSQSGTAQIFSDELASEAKRYGFNAEVKDLEGYDVDSLQDEPFAGR